MKTQVSIDDYRLKIETESMVVSIQLHKHEQHKEILQMTKDLTEMALKSQPKKPAEKTREQQLPEPTKPPVSVKKVRELQEKQCPICKSKFKPRTIKSTYCSAKCGQKAYSDKYLAKKKSGKTSTKPHPTTDKPLPKHTDVIDIDKTLAEIEANRKQPYSVSN